MSAIAQEVSRRMTPGYAKERVKEMARHGANEARDRAVDSSWLMPLVGAGIGALIGKAILSRAQDRKDREWHREEWDRPVRYGAYGRYPRSGAEQHGDPPRGAYGASAGWDGDVALATEETGGEASGSTGVKETLSQRASEVGDRATELKDRMTGKASELSGQVTARAHELGDRLRGQASALRERLPDRETIRSSTYEQPGLWALGAAAVGALFGFALPISDKEREVLEPAKQRMRDATSHAMDAAVEKVEKVGEVEGGQGGEAETDHPELGANMGSGPIVPPGPAPIH